MAKPKLVWRDVSSYSRDEARVPKSVEFATKDLRVCVTRHRDYGPDVWCLVCHDVFMSYPLVLKAKQLEDAKAEALVVVRGRLERMLGSLPVSA
jgi:hypothetical protein